MSEWVVNVCMYINHLSIVSACHVKLLQCCSLLCWPDLQTQTACTFYLERAGSLNREIRGPNWPTTAAMHYASVSRTGESWLGYTRFIPVMRYSLTTVYDDNRSITTNAHSYVLCTSLTTNPLHSYMDTGSKFYIILPTASVYASYLLLSQFYILEVSTCCHLFGTVTQPQSDLSYLRNLNQFSLYIYR